MLSSRKLCTSPLHEGQRWLLWTEFYARAWNEDKTVPITLGSHCRTCVRVKQRISKGIAKNNKPYQPAAIDGSRTYYGNPLPRQRRNERRRARYKDRVDPRLPVDPFRHWLNQMVMENSISGVARNANVHPRRISTFISGYYLRNGRRLEIKHVRYSVVDKFCTSFGVHIHRIYHPELIKRYRVTPMEDDRWKQ